MGDSARFCDQCGTPVATTTATDESATRKIVTVLFADLVGSTAFGERVDAESAREAMAEFHEMTQNTIDAEGGTVAKFIGDGVMALFGVPETAEDDADRAVSAALVLQRGFGPFRERIARRHAVELGLRVGINTGEIVLADGDADLVGDAINTAARLEAACAPGEILVGEDTWRLTRAHVLYEVLGEVEVKGKSEPVATFRVADDAVHDDDQVTPFVGRVEELARLRATLDEAIDMRSARLATVVGSPGVGKTRVAREFAESLGDAAVVAELRCERSGTATFAPIADLLRTVASIDDESDPDHVRSVLRELVAGLDDADRVVELLASFVGAAPVRSTEEAFLAVRRLVEAVGRVRPLVVIVDDIQWAESLFLDLLEHLAEWVADAPALLIGLARPELRELRPTLTEENHTVAATLALEGLDAVATAELAARLVGAESLPRDLIERLPESTEGNPLFVRELMRMLVDDRVIEETANGWQLTIDAEAVEVPPTIQSLLAARLDRMPGDERRLVELASVVGPEFALGAVGAISESGGTDLRVTLERLRRRELIESTGMYWGDEPTYRFHHVLIRDAAYRRLLKRTRADLHHRVGEWTERTAAGLPGEHEVAIAHHYEQAHEYRRQLDDVDDATAAIGRRAAELLGAAAERALERDDLPAASTLAERALTRLGEGDPMIPSMLVVAAEAHLGLGDVTQGRRVVGGLSGLVGTDERLGPWAESFVAQLTMLTEPDRLHEAEGQADRAAARLAELGDEAGVAKARLVRAGALARLGQVGRCEAELDEALTAARSAGDRRRIAAVLGAAPLAALWGPSPIPRAGGRCLDVIRLLRITTGSPAVEATSVRCQAVLEALRGRFDTARTMLTDARATVEELGLRHALNETDLYTGIVELLAGDAEAAERPLRAAYQGLGRLGIGADAGQAAAYLALAVLQLDRVDEAEQLAAESAELAGENPQTAIAARTAQAEILAAQGRYDDAVGAASDAVARAQGTDIIVDHAAASAVLARVARLAGDAETAERAARAAADLYQQKAATVAEPTRLEVPAAPTSVHPASADENRASRLAQEWLPLWISDEDAHFGRMADHVVAIDHRSVVRMELRGRAQVREAFGGVDPTGRASLHTETLAVRGDDLVLTSNLLMWTRGWDGPVVQTLSVLRWTDDDRVDVNLCFELDDLDGAKAELERLHRGGQPATTEPRNEADRLTRRFVDAFTAGAREEWLPMLSPDQETIDRRPLGFDTTGADGVAAAYPRDRQTRAMESAVETIAVRGDTFALVRWKAASAHGREWDGLHLTRWTTEGLNDLNVIFPPDQLNEAMAELDRLYLAEDRGSIAAELPNQTQPIGHEPWNEADRLGRQLTELFLDMSSEAWVEMLDPGHVSIDRQPIVAHQLEDRDATVAIWTRENMDDDATSVVETIATRGEHLALHRWAVAMGSGRWASDGLNVTRWNGRGLVDLSVRFDVGQLREAVAELERLYQDELGDSTEALQVREFRRGMRLLSDGDVDAFIDLHDPSFVLRDHRRLGWAESTLEEYRARLASIDAVAGRALVFQERVLRLDHTTSACAPQRLVVTTPEGSQQVSRSVMVMIADPQTGLITLMEQFEEDQVDEAVARFDELMVERGPVLHNEASRRASFVNGWLRHGDDELAVGAVAEDATFVDEHGDSFELSAVDRREVIAVRGDRLALVQLSGPGHTLVVEEVDEDGTLSSVRRFASEQLGDAMVMLDRRWLEIGGDEVPRIVRVVTEYTMCFNEGDGDRLASLLHEDHELVDHRAFGWPRLRRDDVLAMVGRGEDEGVLVVAERLDADDDASLARVALWVTEPDGASTQGFVAFTVVHVVDGRIRANHFFDDIQTAYAHLDALGQPARSDVAVLDHTHRLERVEGGDLELTVVDGAGSVIETVRYPAGEESAARHDLTTRWFGGLNAARQRVGQLAVALGEAWVAPSTHRLGELLAAEFRFVDGRTLGMGSSDRAGFEEALRGREADGTSGPPVPTRVELVSDDVMVFRANNLGHTPESGVDWEEIACNVLVVEGGRIARLEMFDEDHWDDATARARELASDGASGRPLDNAATRWMDRVVVADGLVGVDGFVEDFVRVDRRSGISAGDADRHELLVSLQVQHEMGATYTWIPLAVRGERFTLGYLDRSYGDAETRFAVVVDMADDTRARRVVQFDAEHVVAAQDELDEMYVASLSTDDAATLRTAMAFRDAYAALDTERVVTLLGDDFQTVDHRPASWPSMDRERFAAANDDRKSVMGESRILSTEILLIRNGVILATNELSGRSPETGAEWSEQFLNVFMASDGLMRRVESYLPGDLEAARARADALIAERRDRRMENAATRLRDRFMAAGGSMNPEWFAIGFSRDDRRTTVSDGRAGRADYLRSLLSYQEMGADFTMREALAIRGERLALFPVFVEIDGSVIESLLVTEVDDEGYVSRNVQFDPEALATAQDELDRRYLETLTEEQAATLRPGLRFRSAMSSTGTDETDEVLADEFVAVDHRDLGFPDLDRDGVLEINRQRDELFGEALVFTTEIHCIEGDVIVASNRMAGLTPGSGVEWLHEFVNIFVVRDGRLHGLENFGPGDLDGAMARADVLLGKGTAAMPAVPNVQRLGQRVVGATAAGDFDTVRECFEEDFVRSDHRRVIGLPDMSRDEYVADLQRQWELGWRDYRTVTVESIRSNGFVALLTTDFEGGSESPFRVLLVEGSTGRIGRLATYDEDDVQSADDDLDEAWLATLDPGDAETYCVATDQYRAYVGLDASRVGELTAERLVFSDHRRLGNFGQLDRAGFLELFEARRDTLGQGVGRVTAVHLVDRRVVVFSKEEHTRSARHGAETTNTGVHVVRVAEGKVDLGEIYDDADLTDALSRAQALADPSTPAGGHLLDNCATRWVERVVAQEGPADVEAFAEDFVRYDRRSTGEAEPADRDQFVESLRVQHEMSAVRSSQVVAIRGDRFGLCRLASRSGSSPVEFLATIEVDDGGRAVRATYFDDNDLFAATEAMSRSWAATLPPELLGPLRVAAEYERVAYTAGLAGGSFFADDAVVVDHRSVGLGASDLSGYLRLHGHRADDGPVTGFAPEVIPVSPHVLLFSNVNTIEAGSGASWEEFYIQVFVARNGKIARLELFAEDQRDVALRRAQDLANSQRLDAT